MIKLIEIERDLPALPETPFGCKIRSVAAAYGVGEPFAQFWAQDGGTVVARVDDTAILEERNAGLEELGEFVRMLDVRTLSCTEETAEKLGLPIACRGEIMTRGGKTENTDPSETEFNPGLREIYALLCRVRSERFVPPDFEPFYMDLSYRFRHGAGMAAGIRRNGELAACALCSSLTETCAVISAVATAPEYRREGLGRAALSALASALNRERIYIFRADGENLEFYRSQGFEPYGRWAEIHF